MATLIPDDDGLFIISNATTNSLPQLDSFTFLLFSDNKSAGFTSVMREAEPANIVIKVESFSSLGVFETRSFDAGNFEWKLTIYPNGVLGEKDNEHIPVYLSIVDEKFLPLHWSADAVFSFFLYNHKLKNYLCFRGKTCCFNANTRNCGFSKLISKKILRDPSSGYLVDDSCVFGAEVSIIIVNFLGKIQDPCYRDWLISRVSKLGDVWTSEIFSSGSRQWGFGPGDELQAEFSITFKSQNSSMSSRSVKCCHRFTCGEHEKGLAKFMPIADFHSSDYGYLVADKCHLGVTMFN